MVAPAAMLAIAVSAVVATILRGGCGALRGAGGTHVRALRGFLARRDAMVGLPLLLRDCCGAWHVEGASFAVETLAL